MSGESSGSNGSSRGFVMCGVLEIIKEDNQYFSRIVSPCLISTLSRSQSTTRATRALLPIFGIGIKNSKD